MGCGRQDVAKNAVVRLTACDDVRCFIDECVAPGTYRYGFVTPYQCAPSSCSTDYFSEATVTAALESTCQRSADHAAPQAFSGTVPWKDSGSKVCGYGHGGCGCSSLAVAVWPVNAFALIGGLALLRRERRRR